jgi:hypothetical protein
MTSSRGLPALLALVALAVAILTAGFVVRALRKPPVPGLPVDGDPLEHWEEDEIERIEHYYDSGAARHGSDGKGHS